MSQYDNVSVIKKANVYFDGKCVSHTVQFADGTKKSVGVILPSSLKFSTGAPEVMEVLAGEMKVLLPGKTEWEVFCAGESYAIPANSSFKLHIEGVADYCCSYG